MRERLRAAVVGLGSIAWGYDGGVGDPPLTHVAALRGNGDVRLVAGVSPVDEERQAFSRAFSVSAYADLFSLLERDRPDLVSLCSPTAFHFEQAMACVEAGVPMIWLEKPPVLLAQEGERLLAAAEAKGTTVLVGYQRRYAEPFVSLRKHMTEGSWGALLGVAVHYALGLYRNGCHGLDLLAFLLDEPDWSLLGVWPGADGATPSFLLGAGGVPLAFVGVVGAYHLLDVTLTFSEGQVLVLSGGKALFSRSVVADSVYPSRWLAPPEALSWDLLDATNGMADSLADLLESHREGRQPRSCLKTALKTQQVMEAVMAGGRR